jgi:(R,R)-butanediol dehydrogenase/meso-butanediol dehydrogenase/diacetyl reductase
VLAAVLHGPRDLRYEEMPVPEPGPDDVQVHVKHNGICGSDLHNYYGGFGTPEARPRILGHELSGVVSAVGDLVTGITTGTPVAVRATWGCDDCVQCSIGVPHLCPRRVSFSVNEVDDNPAGGSQSQYRSAYGAGLSEYVVVPQRCVLPLGENISLAQGALTEPMSVAFNGLLRAGAAPGKSVLVVGAGPIGIGAFLGLRALGVEQIIISEPSPERRAAIIALGATTVLDPTTTDVPATVRDLTGGLGADAVIEAAGTPRSFASAMDACAPHGRLSLIAVFEQLPKIEPYDLIAREMDLVGAIGYNRATFQRVHDLMVAGSYPTDGWVEHIGYEDLTDAFEELRRGERMKLLVDLPA